MDVTSAGSRRVAVPQRRYVSILFADLVGSTELSDQLEPEDLGVLMTRYQRLALATMERYGGFVARFSGDGVLVYFGYPVAHENDGERAVRAGLELIERLARLDSTLGKQTLPKLTVRIGIHSGLVVFGPEMASAGWFDHGAVGHTVNVANRLQAEAPPNAVVVSRETLELVEGLFDTEPLGVRKIKGLAQAIPVHKLTRVRPGANRFGGRSRRGATQMIGRKRALDRLLRLWRKTARQSRCTTVHLVGQAGVGKTRLVAELCTQAELADANILQSNCHEVYASTPLYPIGSLLWGRLALSVEEGEAIRSERVSAFLEELGINSSENQEIVAGLLGLAETSAREATEPTTALIKGKQFTFLIDLVEQIARTRPTLVWIEDAHWLDASSAELLRGIATRLANAPILLLLTFRQLPEGAALPAANDVIRLRPLVPHECLELAKCVPGAQMLPDELLSRAVKLADGIPLFVEQLVLSFIDQGAGHTNLQGKRNQFPLTLTEIVSSTLDRLGGGRRVVQAAACVGRPFTSDFLAALLEDDSAQVIEPLKALVDAEIFRTRQHGAAKRYEFRHSLLQRMAYDSMVETERRSIHGRIVDLLKSSASKRPVLSEVIAHHSTAAARFQDAIGAWFEAAASAARRSAHVEAIEHLRRGFALLGEIVDPELRRQTELNFLAAQIGSLTSIKPATSREYSECCQRGIELCNAGPPTDMIFRFLFGQYNFAIATARVAEAASLAERFLSLASGDAYAQARVIGHRLLGMAVFGQGEMLRAREQFELSVRLYSPERDAIATYMYGMNPKIYSQSMLSFTLLCLGQVDKALQVGIEALKEADSLRHPHSTVLALGFVGGYVFGLCGAKDALMRFTRRLIAISEQHQLSHFRAIGQNKLGWALCQNGDLQQGISVLEPAIQALETAEFRLALPFDLAILADAKRRVGDLDGARAVCARALQMISDTGQKWIEPEALRIEALTVHDLYPEEPARAEAILRRAVECARHLALPVFELRCLLSLKHVLRTADSDVDIRLKELSSLGDLEMRAAKAAQSVAALLSV
jgi:class 3 adenylate cyclase/tetratricopeptide (TPR) repeat protein